MAPSSHLSPNGSVKKPRGRPPLNVPTPRGPLRNIQPARPSQPAPSGPTVPAIEQSPAVALSIPTSFPTSGNRRDPSTHRPPSPDLSPDLFSGPPPGPFPGASGKVEIWTFGFFKANASELSDLEKFEYFPGHLVPHCSEIFTTEEVIATIGWGSSEVPNGSVGPFTGPRGEQVFPKRFVELFICFPGYQRQSKVYRVWVVDARVLGPAQIVVGGATDSKHRMLVNPGPWTSEGYEHTLRAPPAQTMEGISTLDEMAPLDVDRVRSSFATNNTFAALSSSHEAWASSPFEPSPGGQVPNGSSSLYAQAAHGQDNSPLPDIYGAQPRSNLHR